MERTEDRSKALSYIGIEIAEALKGIPKPADVAVEDTILEEAIIEEVAEVKQEVADNLVEVIEEKTEEQEIAEYEEAVTFEKKPSLWQRIKNSKIGKAISYVFKIRIRIELPNALPEGRGE